MFSAAVAYRATARDKRPVTNRCSPVFVPDALVVI